MGLSNYQLVLLDNLIYLDTVADNEGGTIEHIVKTLLYKDGIESSGVGTGTIVQDCMNHYNPEGANCMMSKEEWIEVLQAIEADDVLCSLKIHAMKNVTSGKLDGFRATGFHGLCFRKKEADIKWIMKLVHADIMGYIS